MLQSTKAPSFQQAKGTVFRALVYLTLALPALLIGGAALAQASRFVISPDGQEVTDAVTKLVWRRCAEGMLYNGGTCSGSAGSFSHEAALARAKTESISSSKAWRVPNVKELSSLLDRSRSNPAIDVLAFPATPAVLFWSSSPYAGNADFAWFVDFYWGKVTYQEQKRGYPTRLRLVRASE